MGKQCADWLSSVTVNHLFWAGPERNVYLAGRDKKLWVDFAGLYQNMSVYLLGLDDKLWGYLSGREQKMRF